ncbi:hypothetical protein [Nostoc sp.]|uniref:hypothetical protein n=1 Tax=Nostoc sp. TaxID=1180 RepID=UPI002FF5F84C
MLKIKIAIALLPSSDRFIADQFFSVLAHHISMEKQATRSGFTRRYRFLNHQCIYVLIPA